MRTQTQNEKRRKLEWGTKQMKNNLDIMSVEYHVYRTISVWGLASDLDAYKGL
jgi:hypothetical protein